MEAERERKPVHLSCPRGVLAQASRSDLSFKVFACVHVKLLSTLCDLMDCIHQAPWSMGILQAGILEWVAMPSSRESSQPKD